MKPINYTVRIYQGATWRLEATFSDANGDPIDLSAYAGRMQIRRDAVVDNAVLTLESTDSDIEFGDAAKNLVVKISATETAALPTNNVEVDNWVYDLKIWETADPDYTTIRLLEGCVEVYPAVTRPATP